MDAHLFEVVVKGSLVLSLCLSLPGLLSEVLLTHSREGSPWTMPPALLGQLAFSPVPTPIRIAQTPLLQLMGVGNGGYLSSLYLPAHLARALKQPSTSRSVKYVKQDSGLRDAYL